MKFGPGEESLVDWTHSDFIALKQSIEEQMLRGGMRDDALRRIARLDPDSAWTDVYYPPASHWADRENASLPTAQYEKSLADILKKTGCAIEGVPYVIRGLEKHLVTRFTYGSADLATLAKAFLDEPTCAGARGLSTEDKAYLQKFAGATTSQKP
jgi:hypothetical protein